MRKKFSLIALISVFVFGAVLSFVSAAPAYAWDEKNTGYIETDCSTQTNAQAASACNSELEKEINANTLYLSKLYINQKCSLDKPSEEYKGCLKAQKSQAEKDIKSLAQSKRPPGNTPQTSAPQTSTPTTTNGGGGGGTPSPGDGESGVSYCMSGDRKVQLGFFKVPDGSECQDAIFIVLGQILNIFTWGILIAATIGVVIFGYQYITAGDNGAQLVKAKNRLLQIVIGIVIYAAFWGILNLILPGGLFGDGS